MIKAQKHLRRCEISFILTVLCIIDRVWQLWLQMECWMCFSVLSWFWLRAVALLQLHKFFLRRSLQKRRRINAAGSPSSSLMSERHACAGFSSRSLGDFYSFKLVFLFSYLTLSEEEVTSRLTAAPSGVTEALTDVCLGSGQKKVQRRCNITMMSV